MPKLRSYSEDELEFEGRVAFAMMSGSRLKLKERHRPEILRDAKAAAMCRVEDYSGSASVQENLMFFLPSLNPDLSNKAMQTLKAEYSLFVYFAGNWLSLRDFEDDEETMNLFLLANCFAFIAKIRPSLEPAVVRDGSAQTTKQSTQDNEESKEPPAREEDSQSGEESQEEESKLDLEASSDEEPPTS